MKALAVAFSARKKGNCYRLVEHCLNRLVEKGWETELLKTYDLQITPCNQCDYECFKNGKCPVHDDIPMIYEKCQQADTVIFALPNYGGHLTSLYFAFAERGQFIFQTSEDLNESYLKKINFIIIGNLSAGGDMALHEALYGFANRDYWPETLLFPAREYGQSSLKGNLIESVEVKKRLNRFVEMVIQKSGR